MGIGSSLFVFEKNFCCSFFVLFLALCYLQHEIATEKHAKWLYVELRLISPCYPGTGYGYTTHHVNARLLSQFTVLNIPTPSDGSLHAIYSQVTQSILDEFPPSRFERPTELVEVLLHL